MIQSSSILMYRITAVNGLFAHTSLDMHVRFSFSRTGSNMGDGKFLKNNFAREEVSKVSTAFN